MPKKNDDDKSLNNQPEESENELDFEDMKADENIVEPETLSEDTVISENFTSETNSDAEENIIDDTVTAQPVKFASFEDLDSAHGLVNQNLGILLDVKLQLTVELGKTELPIKKVLELTKGSVVTLDKVAGEPVELYANGKLIAHGEVVVIEDNFGLRITHITPPVKRIDTFNQLQRETSAQQ